MDNSVDRKFPDDQDYASIFSKVIGRELSHGSSADIYSLYWMDFASNIVQTEESQFMDLGLTAVNTSDEFSIQGTPGNRIIRTTDGSHWSVPDHIFGKVTAVGTIAPSSEQDYSYKIDFEIWRENQDFGRHIFQ